MIVMKTGENAQLEFVLSPARGTRQGPRVCASEIARLKAALAGRKWVIAAVLVAELDLDKRTIRALAEAAAPHVISGQRGYCLLGEATPEEIRHAAGWYESQAAKMQTRAVAIRRAAHHLIS